jgi:hypothetical protein
MMSPEQIKKCTGRKIGVVMREFKNKQLKMRSGQPVTNRKQAIAIALSEARRTCM